ncbi:unnamed protein product [Prorocentrum cordatum]|uniref:IPO4/5-like TPR repeats domain-containing protein n=1 Tax=Prorocentrum cordatum TaxID=2364126 RepID=A0ABN9YGS6_9DINO|nr:unnamed protein product [Polarella glacialis]
MAVAPEELVRFCQLLRALLCGHNEQRRESERLYQETKQCDPDRLCRCLITVLTSAPEDTLRQQSAVLLRQCLKATRADFVWPLLPAETREAIKSGLLTAMRGEQVRSTRHKVCDVVAVLASHVLDSSTTPGGWSEVGPALYELMEAQSSEHRESALHVVREMMAVNPPVVQALVGGRIPSVLQACQADPSAYVRKERGAPLRGGAGAPAAGRVAGLPGAARRALVVGRAEPRWRGSDHLISS